MKAAGVTLGISAAGIVFGTILGLFIGLGKLSSIRLIRLPFELYVTIFRGTPMLVQMLFIHFGIMQKMGFNPITSAAVTLTLNAGAYIAEIFRAGIQSIDKGQMEAARSLGMTKVQAMKDIILPQAFKRMIPPLGNESIILLKDSSVAMVIAVPEITYYSRLAQSNTFSVAEPYLMAAVFYLIFTISLSKLVSYLERRLDTG
nr:amino acid ABC transporter permease [Caldalkalibacillus salinus]